MADQHWIQIVTDGAIIEIDDGTSVVDVNSNSDITVEYSGDSKDADSIRGRTIETGTPADQEVLTYSSSSSEWVYQTVTENVDDRVAALIQGSSGSGITWTYDDSAGTLTPTLSIKNADVNASAAIAVSKLAASTVNYGGVTLTLGGSDTTPAFNLSDATAYTGDSSLVTSGALNSGSITSGFGAIDVGSSAISGGTATFTQVDITAEGDLRLQDNSGGQYVGLDAPATVSTSYTLTLPSAVGSANQVLSLSSTDGTLAWSTPEVGDITAVTAGNGLSGGGTSGAVSLALDLNELSAASVNVANDSIAIVDADDSNSSKKESIADLMAAVDGTGLTASSGVLSVDASQTQITAVGTIGTGTWQGSTVAVGYGGTGATSLTDGGVLLGSGTGAITAMAVLGDGEIIIGDGSGDPTTLDVGSASAITTLGTISTGVWNGTSIGTSYTDAKVTSVVAGTAVDVSGTTGDVTVNVDLSELATSTTDGDGDYFVVVDASNVSRKLTKGNISLAGFTGTAATATTASVATTVTISDNESTNENNGLVFTSGGTLTGNLGLESDGDVTYNPSTGKITATGFIGALTGDASGNAATATALETARTIGGTSFNGTANIVPATITVADTTDTSSYVALFESATGDLAPKTDAAITYNAGTGVLTSTFSGNLTGNVTGNTSGSSGSTTGNAATATALETARTIGGTSFDGTANIAVGLAATATALASARTIGGTSFDGTANIVPATITVADTTDTSCSVALFESATGDLAPKSDGGLTYNAGTGTLTATAFAGPLTGNVTGNASGTAGVATTVTISDNESTNEDNGIVFTSGGTLTGNLGLESDGDLTYNPSTGKITATGFIGALTGNASGSSGSCTGNAATATALATARTIGGVSFDGTGNITPNTFGASTFSSNVSITVADNSATLQLISTDDDNGSGPLILLDRDTASPADGDAMGRIYSQGRNDADELITYAQMTTKAIDVSDGTEDGELLFNIMHNGASTTVLDLYGPTTQMNTDTFDLNGNLDVSGTSILTGNVSAGADIIIGATDKLRLDGSASGNTYIAESAADTITFTTEGLDNFVFGGAGNPYVRLQAGNTGVGAIQYYEDDGGSGQVLHFQAGVRGADNKYYISSNATIHSSYALMASGQDVTIGGALSKASGSFKIDHVLPSMESTHDLYHSFVESSEAMLIYRGTTELENGTATVQMDEQIGLTAGTFELLVRDTQVYTTNETSWDRVRGSIDGSTLTIECEDSNCSDVISWLVVGERMDKHMMETSWTDDDGRPILEREKPPEVEDTAP